ncbi:hypothetical protein [Nocardioides sp.]|uniref:hypothetical protein n=1 Tax=Nocardioides sp. TaxID=35761 RepID=UPI003514E187
MPGIDADASAAKAMIDRCRTTLIKRCGAGYPTSNLVLASCTSTKGEGLGWADVLAADSAAGTFEFWAVLSPSVVVKHKVTGVLYKVLIDPSSTEWATVAQPTRTAYDKEKALLTANAGKSWVPSWTAFDSYRVMALSEYTLLYTLGSRYSQSNNPLATSPDISQYLSTDEVGSMLTSGVNLSVACLGRNTSGRLVLLNGCAGSSSSSSLNRPVPQAVWCRTTRPAVPGDVQTPGTAGLSCWPTSVSRLDQAQSSIVPPPAISRAQLIAFTFAG